MLSLKEITPYRPKVLQISNLKHLCPDKASPSVHDNFGRAGDQYSVCVCVSERVNEGDRETLTYHACVCSSFHPPVTLYLKTHPGNPLSG